MKAKPHVLLLTGTPGIGKTTVIRQIAEQLSTKQLAGFYTQEIRISGERKGFIEEVKQRRDVRLWQITRENRNLMPQTALQWLKE